ncbi:MAG TPA: pitrilysin family protein [Elusimicrobiota bacterium]|nr:pitrilysin family protein [Elusimicrobiota bacterium]
MKTFWLVLALAPSALAAGIDMSKPPAIGPMKSVALPPRVEWRLENGLDVVLVQDKRLPMVTAILSTPGGEAAVPAEDAGLADAMGELMTDGTATKTSRQVADAAELFGGAISAGAGPDAMTVEASALSDKADAMFDLLSEVVRSPSFPEAEVALRKSNMQDELEAGRAEAGFLAGVAFAKKLFAGHPYAITAPTDASIARVSRERVVAAYKKLFTPRGSVLVVVGDLAPDKAKTLVASAFSAWRGGPPPPDAPPVAAPKVERAFYLFDRPGSAQVTFQLGNLSAREDDPDYFNLLVANGVLGGSFSSILSRDIREEKGFTYGISSRLGHRLQGSFFKIGTAVRTAVAGPALSQTLADVERFREKGPTPAELSQAQAYLAGVFARGLETQEGVAGAVLHQKQMRLPDDYYDHYVERIQAVTAASARRAAKAYIRPDEMTIVAVGDAAKVRPVLERFAGKKVAALTVDGD